MQNIFLPNDTFYALLKNHSSVPVNQHGCEVREQLLKLNSASISASILCITNVDGSGITRKEVLEFYKMGMSLLTPDQKADLNNWQRYTRDSTVALYAYRRLQWLHFHIKDWLPLPPSSQQAN